jgi:hypothetical protein
MKMIGPDDQFFSTHKNVYGGHKVHDGNHSALESIDPSSFTFSGR